MSRPLVPRRRPQATIPQTNFPRSRTAREFPHNRLGRSAPRLPWCSDTPPTEKTVCTICWEGFPHRQIGNSRTTKPHQNGPWPGTSTSTRSNRSAHMLHRPGGVPPTRPCKLPRCIRPPRPHPSQWALAPLADRAWAWGIAQAPATGSPPGLPRPPWGRGRGRAEGTVQPSCSFSFPLWGFVSSPIFFSFLWPAGWTEFFYYSAAHFLIIPHTL
jgi:hypothetical protein